MLFFYSFIFKSINIISIWSFYPGFTSTIVMNVRDQIPSDPLFGFDYIANGFDPHIMMPSADSPADGGLFVTEKVDTFYPNPPTKDINLILLSIEYDTRDTWNNTLCELKYNVLTKEITWLQNNSLKSENGSIIKCHYLLYETHLFIFVDADN